MALLGFTLNNLTLFGLVLAIGIVVDDAIVVLENIERWLAKGLPRARGHDQGDGRNHRADHRHHAGAVRGVPAQRVHLRGITGQFFRQFALTIAASMIISAINAMTMTPSRAAAIFKNRKVSAARAHRRSRSAALVGRGAAGLAGFRSPCSSRSSRRWSDLPARRRGVAGVGRARGVRACRRRSSAGS